MENLLYDNIYNCDSCGEVVPVISVHFEFEDGSDYDELLDSEEVVEIEEWIKETINEKGWTDIKDYSYGLFCPSCLESLE